MNGHFGGRTLASVAAIAAVSITSALPVFAADSAPEKSTPNSRVTVTTPVQAPASSASAPAPAAVPAAELSSLLRQLELMGDPRLDRSAAGLRVIPLRGGGVSLNLEGRFLEYVVVTRGADGKFRQDCVSGLAAVRRYFMAAPEARRSDATEK